MNVYGFVGNNPLMFVDPLGLEGANFCFGDANQPIERWMVEYAKADQARERAREYWENLSPHERKEILYDKIVHDPNFAPQLKYGGIFEQDLKNLTGGLVAGMTAVVELNPAYNFYEFATGNSGITNEELSGFQQGAAGAGVIVPVAGKVFKLVKNLRNGNLVLVRQTDVLVNNGGALGRVECGAARTTGTVWDSVKATQPLYEGTAIPRSFELATGNGKVWVHGNATEHMAEYATSMLNRGVSPPLLNMSTQAQITSLQSAVTAATANGVPYGKLLNVGGWELKFGAPQQAGQLPALIHALPK